MKTANESPMLRCLTALLSLLLLCIVAIPALGQQRWSEAKANAWYAKQPWPVGSDYIPDDAINQLEMWQAATFDPKEIDRELGWAQGLGMNTMRVFLHDLLWKQDPEGFQRRINIFLTIAARHHIRPIFVLFDSCWDPNPKLGPQHPPIPGVHNSGWVQSPGRAALTDPAQYPRLKAYVQGVIGAFANDPRILAWDIWNEPDNTNQGSYGKEEPPNKVALVLNLLPQVFAWARAEHPTQPLTSGIWQGDWSSFQALSPMAKIQISESDIITFHNYGWPEDFEQRVKDLEQYHRPIICTEYMARGVGSLFDTIIPIAKRYRVGAINWGFVAGKTQTYLPWDSWQRPYVLEQPPVWFHDIFYPNGKPYRQRELEIIRNATGVEQ
ncbi:MAG TPA: cellulase family glycosylhydrolase [Acidobacteriaceae bacterium]|nr:cellulase family glycosylhydrolase [Acidobacteriaceae bacterium]